MSNNINKLVNITCCVDGCSTPTHQGRRFCVLHQGRFQRHGDPLIVKQVQRTGTAFERLLMRVNKQGPVNVAHPELGPCWLWLGAKSSGYGTIRSQGKSVRTHRLAYEKYKGPIPSGLEIDHLCRVPICCNPEHLEVVTKRENISRGMGASALNARKTHCKRGHEFTLENSYPWRPNRMCRTCHRLHARGLI